MSLNLPEVRAAVGSLVRDADREVRVLEYRLPEPHASAVMVLVKDTGTGREYWISATWLT